VADVEAVLGHSLGTETLYTYRSDPSRTFGALNVIAPSLLGAQLSEPAAGYTVTANATRIHALLQ